MKRTNKKCANCKQPMSVIYSSLQKYCTDKDECIREMVSKIKERKDTLAEKKQKKIDSGAYKPAFKSSLQNEINKLSRLIDCHFQGMGNTVSCIDCGFITDKIDAGHFHSVGSNESLRFNLHNIHAQSKKCNSFDGGRQLDYFDGLVKKYGKEYAEYIRFDLVNLYPRINLTSQDLSDKLVVVRKLIRDLDTFDFKDEIHARNQLNMLIGIYTKNFKK